MIWLDRHVQRLVDLVAIWLMHRGVPKSRQHWCCFVADGFSFGAGGMALAMEGTPRWACLPLGSVLLLVSILFGAVASYVHREDITAEARGMRTVRDIPIRSHQKVYVLIGGAMAYFGFRGICNNTALFAMLSSWFALIAGYLNATPRYPPPAKTRVPANVLAFGGAA